jgi:hypothetical protein
MKHLMTPAIRTVAIKTSDVIIERGEPTRGVVTAAFVEYLRSRGAPAELIRSASKIAAKTEMATKGHRSPAR